MINLNWDPTVNIYFGWNYTESWATWTDNVDWTWSVLTISWTVNETNTWSYLLEYTYTDSSSNTTTATRTVNIIDIEAPMVKLNWSWTIDLEVHSTYSDLGATWTDNVDGNWNINVASSWSVDIHTLWAYTLEYTYTDSSLNTGTTTRIVNVVDTTPPVLLLNWSSPLTLERLIDTYNELWADWIDNFYWTGTVTPFSGWTVNTSNTWTYNLEYKYIDSSSNISNIEKRTVNVVDTTIPTAYIEYSITWATNQDVIATLTWASETITWILTHTFTWNTSYPFEYSDLYGNTWATLTWTVTWIDKTAPVITLNWNASVSLIKWSAYTELWAASNDNVDGTWTVLTPFTGSVDINTAWTYTLQYKKIDTAWNVSNIVTRTVIITQPIVSSGWWSGNGWWNSGGGSFYYAPTNNTWSTLILKTIENTWSIEASWLNDIILNTDTWSVCAKPIVDNIAITLIKKYIKNLSINPQNNAIKIDVLKMALLLAYWRDYCNADPSKATFKAVAKILLSWYIDWNNKIVNPNSSITRIEAVKLIINALWVSATDSKKTIFYDIKDDWMNKYLNKALELWIITNWHNFRPMDNVSRYEISVMISKALIK